jgi:Tfp pilus assembly protein PilF
LGFIQKEQLKLAHAEASFQTALKWSPATPRAHEGLVMVYEWQGRHEEANQAARKAIELEPGISIHHRQLAWLLARQGKFAEAETEYREELKLRQPPGRALSHNDLGWVLLRQGKSEEAQREFAEARRLSLTYLHANLAAEYATAGSFWEATQHLLADMQEKPENDASAMRAAMLQLLQGDRAGYEATCQKMLERLDDKMDAVVARRTLHSCLISQQPVGSPAQHERLVAQIGEGTSEFLTARELGLAAYRAGRWEDVLRHCRESRVLCDAESTKLPAQIAINLMIESAALHRLDRAADARGAYYESARQMDQACPYAPHYPGVAPLLAIVEEPSDPQAATRGDAAMVRGDWAEAAREYRVACRDLKADSYAWMKSIRG